MLNQNTPEASPLMPSINLNNLEDFEALEKHLDENDDFPANRLYYLATDPKFYKPVVGFMGETGMAESSSGWRSIVVEKPFGTDLDSARDLNSALHKVFEENQIYRIDHYLGKETAQNILYLPHCSQHIAHNHQGLPQCIQLSIQAQHQNSSMQ